MSVARDDRPARVSRGRLLLAAALVVASALLVVLLVGRSKPDRFSPPSVVRPLHAPRVGPEFFAVNAQALLQMSPSERRRQLALMRRSGIRAVRLDLIWQSVQPVAAGPFEFDAFDAIVADAAREGIRLMPILDYSAVWASSPPGDQKAPPADPATYASFAYAAAARYGTAGSFWAGHPGLPRLPVRRWEVWNEPSFAAFFHPAPDPRRYVALYSAARAAVHAASPDATVYVGGLVDTPSTTLTSMRLEDFLAGMVAADPHVAVDGVAVHSYSQTVGGVLAAVVRLRRAMRDHGWGARPIALNEWGAPARGPGALNPERRAELFAAVADSIPRTNCGVAYLAPHTWWTRERDPNDPEDWFGIANHDGTLTAAAYAYAVALRLYRGQAGRASPRGVLYTCSR